MVMVFDYNKFLKNKCFSLLCVDIFSLLVSSDSYGISSGENHEKTTPEFFIEYVGNSEYFIRI